MSFIKTKCLCMIITRSKEILMYDFVRAVVVTMESSLSVHRHLPRNLWNDIRCIHRVVVTTEPVRHIEPSTLLHENTRLHSLRCQVARGIVFFSIFANLSELCFFSFFFIFQYIQSVYYGIFWIYISLNLVG